MGKKTNIRKAVSRVLVEHSENIAEVGLLLSGCAFVLGFFGDEIWYLVSLTTVIITTFLYFSGQREA